MSEATEYRKTEHAFAFAGVETSPVDAPTRPNRLTFAQNVRTVARGTLQSRYGTSKQLTATNNRTPLHSLIALNNIPAADYTYVAGAGTGLQRGKTGVLSEIATGFSGAPLSMLRFTPEQASLPWVVVGDANKMVKVPFTGNPHQLGLPAPLAEPAAELDWQNGPLRIDIDPANNAAVWTVSPAGPLPLSPTRINTAITNFYYAGLDPSFGSTIGWFSAAVADVKDIGPGTLLHDSSGFARTMFVEEVLPPSPAGVTCTISRLVSDDGTGANWVTIVPSQKLAEFKQHAVVKFQGGFTQTVAIKHVIEGPDNSIALRCFLNFLGTLEGDNITVLPAVYGYTSATILGPNLTSPAIRTNTFPASTVSYLTQTGLTLNLSTYAVGGRAVDLVNDELHCSVFVSDVTRINEIKIEADVDDSSFTKNWYSRSIRGSDLAYLSTQAASAIDTRQTTTRRRQLDQAQRDARRQLFRNLDPDNPPDVSRFDDGDSPADGPGPTTDDPGGSSSQTKTGASQWSEIRFKLSDWLKQGADKSKNLSKVVAIRFVISTTDAGPVDFGFGSLWIAGGYEPDVADGAPYEYRSRYRASSTGARGNWSPTSRTPVSPHRYQVRVQPEGLSGIAECDKIDIQRRGGSVNIWVTIATIDNNGGSPNAFIDIYSDVYAEALSASDRALEGNVNAQPFTETTAAYTATVSKIAGNAVSHSAANFNMLWAQGTPVIANGIVTAIYRMISTSAMLLYDNVGNGINLRLEIPEPRVVGQPLPVVFGPVDGWHYALGSTVNPGRMYIFNQGTLDSTQSSYYVDITDGGDPLQNGCVYANRGYVWSTKGMWTFLPDMGNDRKIDKARVIGAPGLRFRYAMAQGDLMYWVSDDGVYESDGASARSITRGEIQKLFVNDGVAGADYNGLLAPDVSGSQVNNHRLACMPDKTVYYDYVAVTGGERKTLMYDRSHMAEDERGWWTDAHGFGAVFHYGDERVNGYRVLIGGSTAPAASVYAFDGAANGDDGTSYLCTVRTFADRDNTSTNRMRVGDCKMDVDAGTVALAVRYLLDDHTVSVAGTAIPTGQLHKDPPIVTTVDAYARNVAVEVAWTVAASTHRPMLYLWSHTWLPRPDDGITRPTDYTDCGYWGPKEGRGFDVECDTGGATKTLLFEFTKEDGTVATQSFPVTTSQKTIVPLVLHPTVVFYEARLRPTDANTWKYFEVTKWHFDPLTDMTQLVQPWTEFDGPRWFHGMHLQADTNNAVVSIDVQRDFNEVVYTVPGVQHPGRGTKSYSFDPPFIAFMARTAPNANVRVLKVEYVTSPEAPLGTLWETQEIELGEPYGYGKQMEIEYAAAGALTLEWWVDGLQVLVDATSFPATGNDHTFRKLRTMLPDVKGRLAKIKLRSTAPGARVRELGTRVYVVSYNGGGLESKWRSLAGALHRIGGGGGESGAPL
jgi:hypothetical protein